MNKLIPFGLALIAAVAITACKDDVESQLAALDAAHEARREQVQKIPDAEARDTFAFLTRILHQIATSYIEIQTPYVGPTRYTQPVLQRLTDYGSADELAEVFAGSIWAELTYTASVDFQLPFLNPLPHQLTWTSVTLSDGREIAITQDYDATSADIQAVETSFDIRIIYAPDGKIPEDAPLATTLTGQFEQQMPQAVLNTVFGANDTGDTRQLDEFDVKLVAAEDHLVKVQISRSDGAEITLDDDAIFIEARDETGAYLRSYRSSWGDPEQLRAAVGVFDDLIEAAIDGTLDDMSEKALSAEMTKRIGSDQSGRLYGQVGFAGIVDQVEITILPPGDNPVTYTQQVTRPTPPLSGWIRDTEIPDIAVVGSVYDYETEILLASAQIDINPAEVSQAINVQHGDLQSIVRFEYPDTLSGIFLDTFDRYDDDADDQIVVTFYDSANNPIDPDRSDAFEFTINRVEYDLALFPTPPARVAGQFPVRVMTDMPREIFVKDTDPDAVRITGNQVHISRELFRNWDSNYHVIARDDAGRPLAKITTQDVDTTTEARPKIYHFYGQVAEVEFLKRGQIETVIYTFDTALETAD